jgi:hypothetical protein
MCSLAMRFIWHLKSGLRFGSRYPESWTRKKLLANAFARSMY